MEERLLQGFARDCHLSEEFTSPGVRVRRADGLWEPARYRTITLPSGVQMDFELRGSSMVHLERIETPLPLRAQGRMKEALHRLVQEARAAGATISLTVLPDEENNPALVEAIQRALLVAGFDRDPDDLLDETAYLWLPRGESDGA